MSEEQQESNYKHFCRVCRKGFMCGRALGGHMRVHGIRDEIGNIDYEGSSDWEDKVGGNRKMYALRTNPNRLKSCRVCGKEFLSWKSFLEHGKCISEDDADSLVSSPAGSKDDGGQRGYNGWSKRKRSFRENVGAFSSMYPYSDHDEDIVLAKCLMTLSNVKVDMEPDYASKDKERRNSVTAFLAPLTRRPSFEKALYV